MVEICAYYYPGWHDRPGVNCSEWDLVRSAEPYFSGHYQPRVPLNGYYDDTSISTIEKQASLAASHGIDAFIFLWYWKRGKVECGLALNHFMQIESPMRFSLMWCWKLPKSDLPAHPGVESESEADRWVETDAEDFERLIDHCCSQYFSHSGYRTMHGRPILLLYSVEGFREQLGDDGLRSMLKAGRKRALSHGYPDLFLVGVTKSVVDVQGLGFDALSGYNSILVPSETSPCIQDYSELYPARASAWREMSQMHGIPYVPSVSTGWDATPRGIRVTDLHGDLDFPWAPVIVENTPEKFGRFLDAAYDWVGERDQLPFIHLCAWNEWSEGAYLEPDLRYGHAYLETVSRIGLSRRPAVVHDIAEARRANREQVRADYDFVS